VKRRSRPSVRRHPSRVAAAGFALVALLIAVAIIGLATAGTASVISFERRRAAEDELLYVGDQYRRAIQVYVESTPVGQTQYPLQLSDLLRDPRYPGVRRYLRSIYPDPVTHRSDWVLIPAPTGGIMGIHSASERAPIKTQGFDSVHQAFSLKTSYAKWTFCFPECAPVP
jgi:type II secretory pathway pseudopilin PulG